MSRRDCNYYNIDKIRRVSQWDDDAKLWLMPRLTAPPQDDRKGGPQAHGVRPGAGESDYFESRRAQQLLGQTGERGLEVGWLPGSQTLVRTHVLATRSQKTLTCRDLQPLYPPR